MARSATGARKKAVIPKEEIEIRGYIERVIFPSWGRESRNGFAILAINLTGDSRITQEEAEKRFGEQYAFADFNRPTAKGTMPNPRPGDEISFRGEWKNDPDRGWQFAFSAFEIILPTSQQGVIAYFSGNNFRGLGPAAAEKILESLGENCLNLLKENPARAYEIPGLSEKQKIELVKKMQDHGALGDLISLICRHGIGEATAGKIFAHYGPDALNIVKENPYQMIKDVDGIGFSRADDIGVAVGIKRNSPFRIQAAIRHILQEVKKKGHCALPSKTISNLVLKLLGADSEVRADDVANEGRGLIQSGELCREHHKDKNIDLVYLSEMYAAEVGMANKIRSLVGEVPGITDGIIDPLIDKIEEQMREIVPGFKNLDKEQREAVKESAKNRVSGITGGPGTGKSTILRVVDAVILSLEPEAEIIYVTPTGRASKRVTETTGKNAWTVHSRLGYNPIDNGFVYNEFNQLPGPSSLVGDEFSMLDIEIGDALFRAIPDNMRVIMVGDVDQLPSVGPGTVLRDLFDSGIFPVTRLKYTHRQGEGSTISLMADMIKNYDRDKVMPNLKELEAACGGRDFIFIEAKTPEDAHREIKALMARKKEGGMNLLDFQVLTPLREKTAAGALKLNEMIRDIYNPARPELNEKKHGDRVFRHGDKVMWVNRNDRKRNLSNGDIGIIEIIGKKCFLNIDNVHIEMTADDLYNVELAYAFTVHKAQGGESSFVPVVCVESHCMGGRMLFRSLIYTAITRAKKQLVVVGTQKAFEMAVESNTTQHRYGLLRQRLRGEI